MRCVITRTCAKQDENISDIHPWLIDYGFETEMRYLTYPQYILDENGKIIRTDDNKVSYVVSTIEVSTIEELMQLIDKSGEEIVLGFSIFKTNPIERELIIEIYDGYRE